jgi:protein required for attachment to host cells
MQLPHGTIVAVVDGENLRLFRNSGNDADLKLTGLPEADVESENRGSGARHHDSAANPADNQIAEDSFAAGTADVLNRKVLEGEITDLVIIAAPRTLGELRKHYHKALMTTLKAEIAKELTSHSVHDIEKTLAAAEPHH